MPRAKPSGTVNGKSKSFDPQSIKLNDHVFVSPPWQHRMGEPYLIARVMELLPPSAPPTSSSSTSAASSYPLPTSRSRSSTGSSLASSSSNAHVARVKVNYYLRVRDITNRWLADHRLIMATMHVAVVPIGYVRNLCTVKHKDAIGDLEAYKKGRDTFHWHQLYDRYLHRYFDTVATNKIRNAPEPILQHLQQNFEWVLCEVGTGIELCDAQRGCASCSKWASHPESLTCAHCKKVFHLSCLDPPLARKPGVGYSWSCAPCSKAHDEEVEEYMKSGVPPAIKAAAEGHGPKGAYSRSAKGKKKEVAVEVHPGDGHYRTTNGWPFRYFGMHTVAFEVLDPHDSLYPRASTRLGNRYQAVVPDWDPTCGAQSLLKTEPTRVYFNKRSRAGTPIVKGDKNGKDDDSKSVPTRGEDFDVERLLKVSPELEEATLDQIFRLCVSHPLTTLTGVDFLTHALSLARPGKSAKEVLDEAEEVGLEELGHVNWTEEERKHLEEGSARWGNDLLRMWEDVVGLGGDANGDGGKKREGARKIGEVVKAYYMFYGQTHHILDDTPEHEKLAVARQLKAAATSSSPHRTRHSKTGHKAHDSDNESVCPLPKLPKGEKQKPRKCVTCEEKTSGTWWRCPENVGEPSAEGEDHLMCDMCSKRWRHYGTSQPPSAEELAVVKPTKRK